MSVNISRKISYLFFILISAYGFLHALYLDIVSDLNRPYTAGALFYLAFLVAFSLQFRYKVKHVDLVLGTVCLVISLYLVLALGDDYFDWRRGEDHYNTPPFYFGIWSSYIALMNIMSVIMIWSDGKKGDKHVALTNS